MPGESFGVMGNSGQSTGPHVHVDVVEGFKTHLYKQSDIESGEPKVALKQLAYFADSGLFKAPMRVTTYVADPRYFERFSKVHMGLDIVPVADINTPVLYWNRSMPGRILRVLVDSNSYGHCLYVGFEA